MSEEFVLDTAVVRAFVAAVRATIAGASSPEQACEAIRPRFAELLADPDWLPAEYQAAAPQSGMGGGIGQWLLYRAEDHSLSLFSLVVPAASETPIHDHLAWGLVGLYRGEQDEEIYARLARLLLVPFDDLGGSQLRAVGAPAGIPAGAPLPQQIPALVERHAQGLQPLAIGIRRLPCRLSLPELMLLVDHLVDRAVNLWIFHREPPCPSLIRPHRPR
jgi:hypothetical protein